MLTCGRLSRSWAPKCPIGELTFMARLSTCCAMPVLAQSSSSVSCHGGAIFLERWVPRCPWVLKLAGCSIIAVAIQVYQVIKAQRAHLPDHYFPLGWTDHTSLSSIEFFDGCVQKRVEYSQAWPKKHRLFMTQVYTACKDSAYLIHAMASPKNSPSPETEGVIYYAVDLEPLGVPLLSKYSDQRPKNQAELKSLTKCVLSGVQDLHNANYGHTDIRWQNIIQCGNSHRLIDLEFVCKLNQRPFTPPGMSGKLGLNCTLTSG
ncbi:TPA: hypothetical protein ACH3X1_016300 [Trebouxia sp. C0004]